MALGAIHHGKKSAFWRALSKELDSKGDAKVLLESGTWFPNHVSTVNIDVMNIVYQCPQHSNQLRSTRDCMLNTISGRLCNLLASGGQSGVRKLFFRCDTESAMMEVLNFFWV